MCAHRLQTWWMSAEKRFVELLNITLSYSKLLPVHLFATVIAEPRECDIQHLLLASKPDIFVPWERIRRCYSRLTTRSQMTKYPIHHLTQLHQDRSISTHLTDTVQSHACLWLGRMLITWTDNYSLPASLINSQSLCLPFGMKESLLLLALCWFLRQLLSLSRSHDLHILHLRKHMDILYVFYNSDDGNWWHTLSFCSLETNATQQCTEAQDEIKRDSGEGEFTSWPCLCLLRDVQQRSEPVQRQDCRSRWPCAVL